MPRQTAGLEFCDRIAKLPDGGFLFRCQRKGCGGALKFEQLKRNVEDFRTNHDSELHAGKVVDRVSARLTLKQALDDFVAYVGELEAAGKRDPKTTKFYRDTKKRLLEGFDGSRLLSSIDGNAVRVYVLYRLRHGSTGGARVVQELKMLQKAAVDRGLSLGWAPRQFVDEIRPTHREKRRVTNEQMMAFIAALDKDAKEFAFAKLRTLLRNEELYDLRVSGVDREKGLLQYVKRAKRLRVWSVQVVPADLMPILVNRCKDKLPDAFVFTCRGRRVQQSSFRKACLRASKAAEIDPPITSLSFIRHNVVTAIRAALGIDDASAAAGHSSVVVTEKFYDLDADKLNAKKRAAEVNQAAFPIRD